MLLLLSEVLSPNVQQISLQVWRHFNPGNQAALSDWRRVQRNTVGRCEQHEDDVKKHQ